ncbi:MAG TPA: YcnI family protein [Longimicrobiales bacterium]
MSERIRRMLPPGLLLALMAVAASQVLAHAVVYPAAAKPGAYERYVLRVPNERDIATTRVEIRFPANVTVVSFGDVEGWALEVQKDSAQRIIGASWTGTLAPARFVEFPFIAVNPREAAQITWPAYQTYADGERVEWTGAPGSDKPASVTAVGDASAATNGSDTASDATEDTDSGNPAKLPLFVSLGALAIALLAMVLALGARGRDR